jgi:hypothetical protein
MQALSDPQPDRAAFGQPTPAGEVVVLNGRAAVMRQPLTSPLTLIGRAVQCEVRLDTEDIEPLHCALAIGPAGPVLRDLGTGGLTRVNGEPITSCSLQPGDVIGIGSVRLQLHLPAAAQTAAGTTIREKEALRIQAAAVVAQQAALTEEEIRLQQRQSALVQQEQQLASLLEEKRQRLVTLREEARQAHDALRKERASYEERVADVQSDLAVSRRELGTQERQLQAERRQLFKLRHQLKRRWHRHWAEERMTMRRREAALADARRHLQADRDKLKQDQAALQKAQVRYNTELQLSRRQMRVDRERLRTRHKDLHELARTLDQREATLVEVERTLAQEKSHWEADRKHREQEIEGLESRIANQRSKLQELEKEVARRQQVARDLENHHSAAGQSNLETVAPGPRVPIPSEAAPVDGHTWRVKQLEAELRSRIATLETVAGELADQRLRLAEQCERFGRARQTWHDEHERARAELEALALQIQKQEQAFQARHQLLAGAEHSLHERADAITARERHLEVARARATTLALSWEGERERLLANVRAREEHVDQRLALLGRLRERWTERRRRQIAHLRQRRAACAAMRQQCVRLQQECDRQRTGLVQAQRAVAEQALSLEQYRLECTAQAGDPAAAEKRIEHLRRQWSNLSATMEKALADEQRQLAEEKTRFESHLAQLQEQEQELTAETAALASERSAWEQEQMLHASEQSKLRQQVQTLQRQREYYEQQLHELRDEVEGLARMFIEEDKPPLLPIGQAA